jgi:uncharacterized YccA/Bax inhibitor family protein
MMFGWLAFFLCFHLLFSFRFSLLVLGLVSFSFVLDFLACDSRDEIYTSRSVVEAWENRATSDVRIGRRYR